MNLNQLRFIDAVARTRHFGRAAKACHVSQPTLSIGIRKLEEELGVILFERSRSEVRPTENSLEILTQARLIVESANHIKELGKSRRDPLQGPLRLGIINTIGPYLLPTLIPHCQAAAPGMTLLIEEEHTDTLIAHLKAGTLDLLLIARECAEPGLAVTPLYREPFRVTVPSNHPWANRSSIAGHELDQQPLLLLRRGHCLRDQIINLCPTYNTPDSDPNGLSSVLESSSLETIRHMVAGGAGITVLPSTVADSPFSHQDTLRHIPFAEPAPYRTVSLVWRRTFSRQPAVALLASLVKNMPLPGVHVIP
ncbi:transcriptional regulator, LysR family [Magnetococcus marinus MC-1]|uniref:Transcriptional regulator, LysR family n=1 Tax=Magnetococcus marinus (strain ATCC BAA-1437 / JCM 17883 / MC-1) TaxID=156889 RepID=A0LA88_MAGMM|nr:hydrogen peroxide-inducible genes activator [Magnetococcus marinus]ABK44881.1 transcriptional regulator, LysR family [Magnetococcus marinus MC-1]